MRAPAIPLPHSHSHPLHEMGAAREGQLLIGYILTFTLLKSRVLHPLIPAAEQLKGSLHYVISEGNLTATCSANAWPRPEISWIVPKVEHEQTKEVVRHPNGTVSVIGKLHVNSSTSLAGQLLICRVRHMEMDRDYSVKVKDGQWFSVPWVLAIVALLLVFVVLVLTVVCWRRHRKKQSEAKAS
ncbi:OX-2 membrane glycoprotein isoform 2-T9 [Pangshura tecta]